jgi:hypothetical protein
VCEKCEVGLWEKDQICPVCARSSRYGLRHNYCRKAWSLDGLIAFWAYDGVAKKLIKSSEQEVVGLNSVIFYLSVLFLISLENQIAKAEKTITVRCGVTNRRLYGCIPKPKIGQICRSIMTLYSAVIMLINLFLNIQL